MSKYLLLVLTRVRHQEYLHIILEFVQWSWIYCLPPKQSKNGEYRWECTNKDRGMSLSYNILIFSTSPYWTSKTTWLFWMSVMYDHTGWTWILVPCSCQYGDIGTHDMFLGFGRSCKNRHIFLGKPDLSGGNSPSRCYTYPHMFKDYHYQVWQQLLHKYSYTGHITSKDRTDNIKYYTRNSSSSCAFNHLTELIIKLFHIFIIYVWFYVYLVKKIILSHVYF